MAPAPDRGVDPPPSDPLIAYGWSPRVAALAVTSIDDLRAAEPAGTFEPGRVVRVDRGMSIVQTRATPSPLAVATDQGARADEVPVVGDWLVLALDEERGPVIADLLPRCAVAVNHEYATDDQPLHPGDEVAIIPPVSGG